MRILRWKIIGIGQSKSSTALKGVDRRHVDNINSGFSKCLTRQCINLLTCIEERIVYGLNLLRRGLKMSFIKGNHHRLELGRIIRNSYNGRILLKPRSEESIPINGIQICCLVEDLIRLDFRLTRHTFAFIFI